MSFQDGGFFRCELPAGKAKSLGLVLGDKGYSMSKKPKIKIQKVYPSIKAYESDDKIIEKASGLPQKRQTPLDKENRTGLKK